MVCSYELVWPSATYCKLFAHWVAKIAVHENGRFRGRESVFKVVVQKKGCFSGREAVFEVSIQKKGCFSGREDINKKETPSKDVSVIIL